MANVSKIVRNKKREKLASNEAIQAIRKELKKKARDPNVDFEEKEKAKNELNERNPNESLVRVKKRCTQCGRSRGVYRKFELCRCCLRKHAMNGDVPGLTKASW